MRSLVLLAFAVLPLANVARAESTYSLDTMHSQVLFQINHLGINNIYGRFNSISGSFTTDAQSHLTSFQVTADATSVDTAVAPRDSDLRNSFFNTSQFPNITLKSTSIKVVDETTFHVVADLTLLDVTKSVSFDLKKTGEADISSGPGQSDHLIGSAGSFTIKRADFHMTNLLAGNQVGNDVTIMFTGSGVRQ